MYKNVLSDLKIKNAKPKQKNYQLGDSGGLYLNVKPSGSKLWEMRYTSPETKRRKLSSFGAYPITTLSMARAKRDEFRALIASGIDPIEEKKRKTKKKSIDKKGLMNNVIDEWLKKESIKTKEVTHITKVRLFDNDVKPYFKNVHIKDIEVFDIVKILEIKQKTAVETSHRLFSYLSNLFKFAILKGYCKQNPLANINKLDILHQNQVKNYAKIVDIDILKELVESIYNYHASISVKNCLKLIVHVPLRAENLCNLTWEQVDFDNRVIVIPRKNMKVKNPNIDDFKMPLTNEAISILNDQLAFQNTYSFNSKFVFCGNNGKKPIAKESPNRAIERMGFNDEEKGRKIRLHGFRGTFRSLIDTLDEDGKFTFEVKERALDHHEKSSAVRAYNNKANYQKQMTELMNFWSDFICGLKE